MVILIGPALEGLQPQWREAAENLGASAWAYWRHVALPVLAPALAGATLVLFGNAFAAYATALALTSGTIPLVPTAIASALSGNVLANQQNVGLALGFDMVIVIGVVMVAYLCAAAAGSRWVRPSEGQALAGRGARAGRGCTSSCRCCRRWSSACASPAAATAWPTTWRSPPTRCCSRRSPCRCRSR